MNNEKLDKIIPTEKLDNVLPKYDPVKLSGKNLAQQYVSAFNTGMNVYQCINQLQGYIEWLINSVNTVVKSWNDSVDETLNMSIEIVKDTTTQQFNVVWEEKQPELTNQVNTLTTNKFDEKWEEKQPELTNQVNTLTSNKFDEKWGEKQPELTNQVNTLTSNKFDEKWGAKQPELTDQVNTLTTSKFNVEWQAKQSELTNQVNTLTTNKFNEEKSVFNNELSSLNSRMNTFTKLAEGSTTGDAELQDMRTWFNGDTSDNAGSAVRGADELEYNLIQNLSKTCVNGECVLYSQQHNTSSFDTINLKLYKGITYNLHVDSSANCSVTILSKDDERSELISIWGEKSITFTPNKDITRAILWINSTTPQQTKFIARISQKLQNNKLIVAKNNEGDFTKLKDCLEYVNSHPSQNFTVLVKRGTYDLIEEFGENYFNTNQGVGLILNNNVHMIFSPDSLVKCNYTGDNTEIMSKFSPFNASYNNDHLGFTLENLTLECSNVRYAIHDDTNGQSTPYTNKYINCNIKLDNSNNQHGYKQCIGGGCGGSSHIVINNCIFESVDADTEIVTYHNGGDGKSNVNISNCYFKGKTTCRCSNYGPSTKQSILNVNNCSMYYEPRIIDETTGVNKNFTMLQFNNEIRKP